MRDQVECSSVDLFSTINFLVTSVPSFQFFQITKWMKTNTWYKCFQEKGFSSVSSFVVVLMVIRFYWLVVFKFIGHGPHSIQRFQLKLISFLSDWGYIGSESSVILLKQWVSEVVLGEIVCFHSKQWNLIDVWISRLLKYHYICDQSSMFFLKSYICNSFYKIYCYVPLIELIPVQSS